MRSERASIDIDEIRTNLHQRDCLLVCRIVITPYDAIIAIAKCVVAANRAGVRLHSSTGI